MILGLSPFQMFCLNVLIRTWINLSDYVSHFFILENMTASDTTCPLQEFQNNLLQEETCLPLAEFLESFLILCCKHASLKMTKCHFKPRAQVNILPTFIPFSILLISHSLQRQHTITNPHSLISNWGVIRTGRKEAHKSVCTPN